MLLFGLEMTMPITPLSLIHAFLDTIVISSHSQQPAKNYCITVKKSTQSAIDVFMNAGHRTQVFNCT